MTNNPWYTLDQRMPEQGKKIMCMNNGDFYVAQRFGRYWPSIPFIQDPLAKIDPPQKWQEIQFCDGYEGYVKVMSPLKPGVIMTLDMLEKYDPELYHQMVEAQAEFYYQTHKQKIRK